jgi:hypothetical protein
MSKMGSHDPFEYLKHKLWPKEGPQSNCQLDSRPLKVKNLPNFLACRWCVAYHWKAFNKGYNFALDLISIEDLHKKLWASKISRVLILGISVQWHLGVGLMVKHKKYYKGEGGGFPKSGLWWVLWICVCSWLVRASKVLQLCINKLVVWFMQVHVNNWPVYHSF